MMGEPLPEQDHIARYCTPKTLSEVGCRPTATSFMPKPGEPYLSVNWLEYFGDIGQQAQLTEIRHHIDLELAATGKFAILNVGTILTHVHANIDNQSLAIRHEPEASDPSHSGIHGYKHDDDLVANLIAEVVQGTHPARET